MRRTTQQTLLAINFASQQKLTKLYLSAKVRTQFKLLTVPFKPLRCCLRSDKLVFMNYHVWKFCKDLFLNFRAIWPINQIDFLMVSSLILLRSLRVYIIKQLFFSILITVALGIFNSPLHASVNKQPPFTSISKIIVKCTPSLTFLSPLEIANHIMQNRHAWEQETYWVKKNKEIDHFKRCKPFVCLVSMPPSL